MSHCRACFTSLHGEPSWKTLCRDCFVAARKDEQRALQEEVVQLREEVAFLRSRRQLAIEPTMIRTLLQLCHPDRHGDSQAATRATQYLLSLRRWAEVAQ